MWLLFTFRSTPIFFELTPTAIQLRSFTTTLRSEILRDKNTLRQKKFEPIVVLALLNRLRLSLHQPFLHLNSCLFYYQLSLRLKRLLKVRLRLLIFFESWHSGSCIKMQNPAPTPPRPQAPLEFTAATGFFPWMIKKHCLMSIESKIFKFCATVKRKITVKKITRLTISKFLLQNYGNYADKTSENLV